MASGGLRLIAIDSDLTGGDSDSDNETEPSSLAQLPSSAARLLDSDKKVSTLAVQDGDLTGSGPFDCNLCNKTLVSKSDIEAHLNSKVSVFLPVDGSRSASDTVSSQSGPR